MPDSCETNVLDELVRVLNNIDNEEPDEQIIKMEFVDVNEVENVNREEPLEDHPLEDQPLEDLEKCQSEIKKLKKQIKQLQILLDKSEFQIKNMENKLAEVFTSSRLEQLKNNSGHGQWVNPDIARKGLVDMESDEELELNKHEVDLSSVGSGEELSDQNFLKIEDTRPGSSTQNNIEDDDIIVYIPVNEDDETLITKIRNLEQRQLKIEAIVKNTEHDIRSVLRELILIRTMLQKNEKNNKDIEEIGPKLKLPAETIHELQNLEARLNNEPAVEKYLETLFVGQRNLDMTKFIRNSLAKIMTDECAKKCSWHGLQGNIAVKKYLCFKMIKDAALKKYPNGCDEDVINSMKKWLHLARDRLRKSNKTIK